MSVIPLIETQIFTPVTGGLITEGRKSDRGNPIVEGILATAEVENGNGRYYRKSLWEREMKKYDKLVKDRRALGELDHPDSTIINLKNVSHNIIKWWWDGNNIMGIIEILPTPSGNILKTLFENNIKVGVSSRGQGSLEENFRGVQEVQDDFDLLCWDFISTPSNKGSWMNLKSNINESMNFKSNPYTKLNSIITDILCAHGTCPTY